MPISLLLPAEETVAYHLLQNKILLICVRILDHSDGSKYCVYTA